MKLFSLIVGVLDYNTLLIYCHTFISILSLTGSVEGGSDIVENTNVGIVNHVTFHNLHLQNGHDYFASVKGMCVYLLNMK